MVQDGRWIIDDAPLQEVVKRLPKTTDEFKGIDGIGKVKERMVQQVHICRQEQTNMVQDSLA